MSSHSTVRLAANWVLCEQTGRWVAAIRLAFLRFGSSKIAPRFYETRTLDELRTELKRPGANVALVEVRRDNLPQVFDLFSSQPWSCATHLIALMDYSLWHTGESSVSSLRHRKQQFIDALREAGALDVVESPRRLHGLLQLGERLASQHVLSPEMNNSSTGTWARSIIPWQDA
jgi:hypothetical protein